MNGLEETMKTLLVLSLAQVLMVLLYLLAAVICFSRYVFIYVRKQFVIKDSPLASALHSQVTSSRL